MTLLKRGHRKVEMTQSGKIFYKRSLQMISLSEMTFHEIQDMQKEVLRVGVTSSNFSYSSYYLFRILIFFTLSFSYL